MTAFIRTEQDGGVLRIILNDDATRNSLSEGMMADLQSAFDRAEADPAVQAIIVSSNGKIFSSGHNLKQLTAHRADADKGAGYFEKVFGTCAKLMTSIAKHRCAIIAEVDGLASAAGCQLVATCDLAYASPRAAFCTPGVNIGLFCSTPMVPLSRAVSSKHAMEMLLTGDIFDADYALRAGLINAVVPQNELAGHTAQVAKKIASKSQAAVRYGKRAFQEQRFMALEEAYAFTSGIMASNMLDGAACEGLDAFINKRHPHWPPLT
ncbi:MAG: enoyl-CoA hydratase [Proteobacteria bacterium]|nr:enoyl-CoA hydratase [Pseudomonadota bacterium]